MKPYKANNNTTFLTSNGFRKPKEIWYCKGNDNEIYSDISKKGVISHVNRINKLLITNPELFKN